MGITEDAMKLAVYLTVGLMLFAATWAVSTETDSYAEMAALETDNEWSPKAKVPGAQELISEKAGPSPVETRFDDGSDINNPTSLFPGPVYGLPGYKESHDWLKDLDWWSPLVFDWRYYKARCAEGCHEGTALKDMSEGAIKITGSRLVWTSWTLLPPPSTASTTCSRTRSFTRSFLMRRRSRGANWRSSTSSLLACSMVSRAPLTMARL